jgi:hypothetical protein
MSADQFLFEETVDPQVSEAVATDKRLYYIQDQNGGAYNGQIQFDTSTLANSGQWLAYSEAVLEIPFTITYQSSADLTGGAASYVKSFMAGLKNGYYQIIDSIQVDYNNSNVVQLQPFTNFFVQYKLMSSMGVSDLKKWGSTLNFAPDDIAASYATAAAANGDGVSNNVITNPTANNAVVYDASLYYDQVNNGFRQRVINTGFPASSDANATIGYGNLGTFLGPAASAVAAGNCAQVGKNFFNDNGGAGNLRIWSWNIVATIRLKDLADFFDKLPLVRGAFMRITVNYNSCTSTATFTTNANVLQRTWVSVSHIQRSGRTNPVMLTSAAQYHPVNLTATTHTATVGSQVVSNPLLSAARLYVNAYTLNSVFTRDILTTKSKREVKYLDIYNYVVSGVAAGGQINAILTNGIVNPKYVVIIPQLTGTAANTGLAIAANPYQSLFDSSPATTCPLALLGQFNIQVAGANMYQSSLRYDYEVFYNEVSSINAINGGLSTGLTSGLISQSMWDNLYRYYVCDLSRRVPSEDGVAKSVVFQGVNQTTKTMDYICFIAFERKVVIDMETGLLLPS